MAALFIWASILGIGVPTLIAFAANWHDAMFRRDAPSLRAPRRRRPLTVIIYHTHLAGTRESLAALRRITSIPLSVVIVVPATRQHETPQVRRLRRAAPHISVHCKTRQASRALTIASCYRFIAPAASLLILDSGDIASATTIHTAQRLFVRQKSLSTLFIERTRQPSPDVPSLLAVLATLAKQVLYGAAASLRLLPRESLTAGTMLRSGYQLRTRQRGRRHYSRLAPILHVGVPRPPTLSPSACLLTLAGLAGVSFCYYLAASLQTAQPLVLVWILCSWWGIAALSTYHPSRRADLVLLISIIPLMGILIPVGALLLLITTIHPRLTLLLRQSLAWTRRQHTGHGIFFGTRHP